MEEDDFWIDEFKLENQKTILDLNPEYAFCFVNSITFYEHVEPETLNKQKGVFTIRLICMNICKRALPSPTIQKCSGKVSFPICYFSFSSYLFNGIGYFMFLCWFKVKDNYR